MPRKVPTSAAATCSPISSGGPPSEPMVITTPSTAATMPRPGSAVGHRGERVDRLSRFVMMHLHVQLHHLIHVERLHAAGDGHAQRVADKVPGMMVVEELGIVFEEFALLRLFHVHFDAAADLPCAPC